MTPDKKDPNDAQDQTPSNTERQGLLIEGQDYYVEAGNYVFTAAYLKRRGYCCGNGCRHCPWDK